MLGLKEEAYPGVVQFGVIMILKTYIFLRYRMLLILAINKIW